MIRVAGVSSHSDDLSKYTVLAVVPIALQQSSRSRT